MTNAQLLPAIIIPLVAWRIYRRVRRNIGRQPFRPKRTLIGTVFFVIILTLIAVASAKNPPALAALGGGLLLGVPLGFLGLHLTKFESLPEGKFFTPNTWLGVTLTLILLGRVAYRLSALTGLSHAAHAPSVTPFQSPLTALMFALLAGYYITYNLGVYQRARALPSPPTA